MLIFIPKEVDKGEWRVPMSPETVAKLVKLGAEVVVEAGVGVDVHYTDADYKKAGATVAPNRRKFLSRADVILRLNKPPEREIGYMKKGCIHISHLDPFNEGKLVQKLKAAGISAISMEMVPRITRAQKMDALSSQASLAGYAAVVTAADRLQKAFPMMMTAAGTISPARVFIIGAGVAGLQAIATAKRMGARVEAFDTRPVVEEQVKSLGAKFVKIDLGETGQTKGGYAKALTKDQIKKQQEGMAKHCAMSDVVITTAKLFGRPAPTVVTKDMLKKMKPGSVVIDLAASPRGGNVEGSKCDKEVELFGVHVVGISNLPGEVALDASNVYGNNLYNLVDEFWDKEKNVMNLPLDDDIIKGCLITHDKKVVNQMYLDITNKSKGKKK